MRSGAQVNTPATGDLQGTYPNLTIRNNAVTTGKIADNAVTTGKIVDNAVTTGKIVDNAVTTPKLADLAVTNTKLGNNAVTSDKILNGQIRAGDMGPFNIRTAQDLAVPTNGSGFAIALCAGSEIAFGGGAQWSGANPQNVGLQAQIPAARSLERGDATRRERTGTSPPT